MKKKFLAYVTTPLALIFITVLNPRLQPHVRMGVLPIKVRQKTNINLCCLRYSHQFCGNLMITFHFTDALHLI